MFFLPNTFYLHRDNKCDWYTEKLCGSQWWQFGSRIDELKWFAYDQYTINESSAIYNSAIDHGICYLMRWQTSTWRQQQQQRHCKWMQRNWWCRTINNKRTFINKNYNPPPPLPSPPPPPAVNFNTMTMNSNRTEQCVLLLSWYCLHKLK